MAATNPSTFPSPLRPFRDGDKDGDRDEDEDASASSSIHSSDSPGEQHHFHKSDKFSRSLPWILHQILKKQPAGELPLRIMFSFNAGKIDLNHG